MKTLVQTVVDEIYGGALAPSPIPIGNEDWSLAWIAISKGSIVGVVLTHEEWVSDLWVLAEYRSRGVGAKLLLTGESEIVARGHYKFRLRVVKSNTRAVDFYQRMGWGVEREFQHETLPAAMLEMSKTRTPEPHG